MLYKYILETAGYDVSIASTGQECLERLISDKPDLILLDLMMPDMNGVDVAKEIRTKPGKYGNPAIVILTAYLGENAREKASQKWVDGYVTKTEVINQELVDEVERYLSDR